jgi:NAD(P)-dependent dehydrogenase (short-subunit alcohol dehydrogenase family)
MELGLRGRKALITGASKGIGLACSAALAEEGCDVILVSRNGADLEKAAQHIRSKSNVSVTWHATDLSSSTAVTELTTAYPDIDILVNNAGAIPGGSIDAVDEARWRHAWDLKVFGYINMTRAYLALMRPRRSGVIINMLGLAGEKPDSAYIAGSAGNASLMADNIRVVGINPGPVLTERLETLLRNKARVSHGDESRWEEFLEPLPFGRAAHVEEVAAMTAFLASDRASYISGTIVTIDGGAANRGAVF